MNEPASRPSPQPEPRLPEGFVPVNPADRMRFRAPLPGRPAFRPVLQPRVSCITKLRFTTADGEMSGEEHYWNYVAESKEQPWGPRHLSVGEGWHPLPEGWGEEFAGSVSIVDLLNREDRFVGVMPTQEERDEARAKVIEVGVVPLGIRDVVVPCGVLRPLSSLTLQVVPGRLGDYRVRCLRGSARLTVVLYPG